MPRVNRTEICASDEIQAFHLINRCVRRTFLCGKDRRSRKDYSHRKEWIRERLEELAGMCDPSGFIARISWVHT
ncbi:MAG: hypothetical protein ACK58T_42885, partial [Phycisphaerae bacterium]